MRVGMFTRGYERLPMEQMFIDAKRFGYDYIEMWGGRPHAYAYDLKNHGQIDEIKALIEKYEMPIDVFCPEHNAYMYNYMVGPEYQRQDTVEYLKTCMDMAKEMGASHTLISAGHAGYYTSYREMWDRFIKTAKELADHAAKIDHKLIMEPMTPYETNVIVTSNDLQRMFEEIDNDHLVTMVDIVAPFSQGESILTYFEKFGDNKLDHIHFIDGVVGSDSHMVPGTGDIPQAQLVKEMKKYGYDKTCTIELVLNYMNEPTLYAKMAVDNLREMMDAAGYER